MKNLFKKSDKKTIAKSQILDKKQLEKVIGGAETTTTAPVQEGKKGLNAVNVS